MGRATTGRRNVALEPDRLATVPIALLTIAVLAITAAAAVWPAIELRHARRHARTGMPEAGPSIVLERLFPSPRRPHSVLPSARNARTPSAALAEPPHEYEWVDRDRGIAAVPIDEAMRLRAAGVRP